MEKVLMWGGFIMDAIEVGALCVLLLFLYHLRRDMAALLRIARRKDRKTPDGKVRGVPNASSVPLPSTPVSRE